MAEDIAELVRGLGYDKVDIVGHGIGAQVGLSSKHTTGCFGSGVSA
jgi:pimeloyl-ACP methyl ester carboxylesterase